MTGDIDEKVVPDPKQGPFFDRGSPLTEVEDRQLLESQKEMDRAAKEFFEKKYGRKANTPL